MVDSYYDYREESQYTVAYEEDGHGKWYDTNDCIEARAIYNEHKAWGQRVELKNNWYEIIWDDEEEDWR